jgi:hypothetical protein
MAKASKAKDDVKKTCPVTRAEFLSNAPSSDDVMTKLRDDVGLVVKSKFSSNGFGYYGGGKVNIRVGEKMVRCQVSMNVVVIDSKYR